MPRSGPLMMPRTARSPVQPALRDGLKNAGRYTETMFEPRSFRHCKRCGAAVAYRIPRDDNRERATCTACGFIHYENPLIVVGTLPVWHDQVLLCRRNIEPRFGLWTLPAGFLELGETTEAGAIRETIEEAGARIELHGLYTVIDVVRAGQVHLFYRATLVDTDFDPGPETIEAGLFAQSDVPWEHIAFATVRETLQRYFADRVEGRFGMHCTSL
jgi:ADP-ribose pyrophosphatase YjhB (NUDIX family)